MVDLWSDLLDNMEVHLELIRSGVPLGSTDHHVALSADYFRMIEAVEYTRKQVDSDDNTCLVNKSESRSPALKILHSMPRVIVDANRFSSLSLCICAH